MRTRGLLIAALVLGLSSSLRADEYPVSGVWASTNDPSTNPATACEAYSKNPKAPTGYVVVFNGSKRIDYNAGYLEEETVNNIAVRKDGPGAFRVVDRYYHDGEGGGRVSLSS